MIADARCRQVLRSNRTHVAPAARHSFCVVASAVRIAHRAASRVGLIAGWGRYPIVVAQALAAAGCQVYCLGIKDHADPALAEICHALRLDRAGTRSAGVIRYFRRHGVIAGHDGRQGPQGAALSPLGLVSSPARLARAADLLSAFRRPAQRRSRTTACWARSSRRSRPPASRCSRPPTTFRSCS